MVFLGSVEQFFPGSKRIPGLPDNAFEFCPELIRFATNQLFIATPRTAHAVRRNRFHYLAVVGLAIRWG